MDNQNQDPNNHPAVISRNLEKLERSTNTNFEKLYDKIDTLVSNFATKIYVDEIVADIRRDHKEDIDDLITKNKTLADENKEIKKKIEDVPTIKKIVFGLAALILVAVVKAVIDLVVANGAGG